MLLPQQSMIYHIGSHPLAGRHKPLSSGDAFFLAVTNVWAESRPRGVLFPGDNCPVPSSLHGLGMFVGPR